MWKTKEEYNKYQKNYMSAYRAKKKAKNKEFKKFIEKRMRVIK